ncbi:MAG: Flp pilus assembly complex ATPase component TadA, partial [Actinomycetota bacterium]|nr:Flp pilus assembly complex ATPase component TadA [Actinomycetota bacterium]
VKDAVAGVLSERRRAQASMPRGPASDEEEAAEAEVLIWEELDQIARKRTNGKVDPLDQIVEQRIMERVRADLFGLGGFEPYLADETIEDIFVNGCDRVFVTRVGGGQVDRVDQIAESDDALIELINRWAARKGRTERRFDVANPRLNLKLPGGFRMHAIMEVTERPTITIRCPRHRDMTLSGQQKLGTIDDRLARFLSAAVKARCNIIVSGGTGSGKTTLLRSLLFEVPGHERIVTIEDTTELGLSAFPDRHPNIVEMETRDANLEGIGEISMMDLTREVLRMSPDRVIVGEVRGAEALYMLKAMSQGNDGSMCSVHADSARGVAGRLRGYVAEGVTNMPTAATDSFFKAAVD